MDIIRVHEGKYNTILNPLILCSSVTRSGETTRQLLYIISLSCRLVKQLFLPQVMNNITGNITGNRRIYYLN